MNKSTADFVKMTSPRNLELAWKRLERAREPAYKWYWRPSLRVAAKAKSVMLKRLSKQLKSHSFQPDPVCLYSEPKSSSLLRHRSILAIGDQIVYQAIGNIVADKLYTKTRSLYYTNIFGNLYNGSQSEYFLQRWEKGYRAFNEANRRTFRSGKTWLVQFDFASFYDSIGHDVLSQLLIDLGVGADVCSLLCDKYLPRWSCAGNTYLKKKHIFPDAGIPQGPIASPILADVVLNYVDEHMIRLPGIKYLRYADDIRIWASSEGDARYAAAYLDRLSRNIGVFPQVKKFALEEVKDINEVIKEISIPDDISEPDDETFKLLLHTLRSNNGIKLLWILIEKLKHKLKLTDSQVTEFKFLLGSSIADSKIAIELCDLLVPYPHFTEVISSYIERVSDATPALLSRLVKICGYYPGYPWHSGRILRVLWIHRSTLNKEQKSELRTLLSKLIKYSGLQTDCLLKGMSLLFSTHLSKISSDKIEKWFEDSSLHWWTKVWLILNIEDNRVNTVLFQAILTKQLVRPNREVARAAAHRLCTLGTTIPSGPMDEDDECRAVFNSFGLGVLGTRKVSRVNHVYGKILEEYGIYSISRKIDWKLVLGQEYEGFDSYATKLYGECKASGDLFIQLLFAAWEGVLERVWDLLGCTANDNSRPGGKLRTVNGKVKRPEKFRKDSDLRRRMPDFCKFILVLDDVRHHSHAAHRKNDHTNLRNRPVSFEDVRRVLKLLPMALTELEREFPET